MLPGSISGLLSYVVSAAVLLDCTRTSPIRDSATSRNAVVRATAAAAAVGHVTIDHDDDDNNNNMRLL